MASWPDSVKTFTTLADGVDDVLAAHPNERGDEITAIQTWLASRTVMEGLKLIWNSATSLSVGTGHCFAEDGSYINVTSVLTASGLSLTATMWYHVYVYLSGGSPAMEVVTTAPTAWKGTAYSKTGATSRRYVGSVKTDGSGNVYNFFMQGNFIHYRANLRATPFRVLSSGTATTETSVACSFIVPVTSRLATLRSANSDGSITFVTGTSDDGITLSSSVNIHAFGPGSQVVVPMLLDSSQAFTYMYASSPSGSAFMDVHGYQFER